MSGAKLTNKDSVKVLGWIVFNVVPLVVENPRAAYEGLLARTQFTDFVHPSDLAFAFNAFTQGIGHWKNIALQKLTAKIAAHENDPWIHEREILLDQIDGYFYKDGLACEESKCRYDRLQVYFFNTFYTPIKKDSNSNVCLLHQVIDYWSNQRKDWLVEQIKKWEVQEVVPRVDELTDEIIHRIFYRVHD